MQQEKAIARAAAAHQGQRYGDFPYLTHLLSVVENLHRFGVATPELVLAGWLHDAVEDTDLTVEDVRAEFGDTVAELVYAVTTEDGKNRKERNARTYPKMAAIPEAVRLKLADRIANVESCWQTQDSKLFMYQREYRDFRQSLRDDSDQVALAMWNHLDKLLGWWEK
jgi:(p)ppGpp synthase/HD superfamily hydrolase